jgi:hypothetical protein
VKKRKRARTERREADRRAKKQLSDRLRLAALEPGGAPDRPVEVASASQIDVVARSMACPACSERLFPGHQRSTVAGGRVRREVDMECRRCGHRRSAYFVVVEPLPC